MGSRININREEVRATYLATGSLKEAARLHGIKEATVRQWAKRMNWETSANAEKLIVKAKQIAEIKRENGHSDAVSVCHASDALQISMEENKKTFHSAMAQGLTRAANALQDMDDLSALESSRRMVDLATAGKTIFGIGSDTDKPTLSLNVLHMGIDALASMPVMQGKTL
jgi:transposase-like protein